MESLVMRIVLDVDGVLYKLGHGLQYMWARRDGLATREEMYVDETDYNLGHPQEDWNWAFQQPQVDYLYRHAHLYSGAVEFVYDLAQLGEILLVTKRPHSATKVTLEWITFSLHGGSYPGDEPEQKRD
jgi:phosphoglycolate phosphatase-like HAD superfamily hydrolase